MNDRITIQRRENLTVGTRGQAASVFATVESRWSKFVFLSGKELENARKVYAEVVATVEMRKPYQYDLTTQDQIVFRGETFGIAAILPVAPRFEIVNLMLSRVR